MRGRARGTLVCHVFDDVLVVVLVEEAEFSMVVNEVTVAVVNV